MPQGVSYDYDSSDFPSFAVTVDVVLFTIRDDELNVLLIKRGGEPYLGAWALPGGFVRPDEDLDSAAARELEEETGLEDGEWHLEQLAAYGEPDRDPRMRVVTVAYWAICADLPAPRGGGDAAAAAFVPVERIESGAVRLAFDHEQIVRDAVEHTRSRLEHTVLAAKFCQPEFTVSELRRVYEAIWGISLDPGNFHRYVRESGAFEKCEADDELTLHDTAFKMRDTMDERAMKPRIVGKHAPHVYMEMEPGMKARETRGRFGRPASLWMVRRQDSDQPRSFRMFPRPKRR